jgi:hypothetical protein
LCGEIRRQATGITAQTEAVTGGRQDVGMRPEVYGRIAGRASYQLGLITVPQLTALGVTEAQRRALLAGGAWERLRRRVLRDCSAPRSTYQDLLAEVLDVPGSVVTGSTAAWLVGNRSFAPGPVHLLVKRGGNHRTTSAVLHETFWLPERHTQVVQSVPCVADARLPFELAWELHPERLRRVVDWLKANRGMDYRQMALFSAELWRRGKPGSAEMHLVVEERAPGYVPPASEIAALFDDVCARFGIPLGRREVNAGGEAWIGRVDVIYDDAKLIVELDSRRWHDTSSAFEDDRRRDNALVLAGWRVIRITWRMLMDEPERVADLLRSLLFVR